jgi:hypothetical protein
MISTVAFIPSRCDMVVAEIYHYTDHVVIDFTHAQVTSFSTYGNAIPVRIYHHFVDLSNICAD